MTETPRLIGVIHLSPLPGAPGFESIESALKLAIRDAIACVDGGINYLVIENFGDTPFFKTEVPPETVAAMARIGSAVKDATGATIGFNVLRNDARAALALCAACGGEYIRVNVHTGAMVTDQGLIEGDTANTLRIREQLCPQASIFADVLVKHAAPLGSMSLIQSATDTWERGSVDALILSGTGTGKPTPLEDLQVVREALPSAKLLVGSGATIETAEQLLQVADGLIVGTALKSNDRIDPTKVKQFADLVSSF